MMEENKNAGSVTSERLRRPGGPRRLGAGEKAKDFKGTWLKLLRYSKRDFGLLIIALLCAVVSTVFTLLGPNRLGDLTDLITDGIKPDTEALQDVSESITTNMGDNLETTVQAITENMQDPQKLQENVVDVLFSSDVPDEDKQAIMTVSTTGGEIDFTTLSDTTLDMLFDSIEVNGSTITGSEQMETLTAVQTFSDSVSESEIELSSSTAGTSSDSSDAKAADTTSDSSEDVTSDIEEISDEEQEQLSDSLDAILTLADDLPESGRDAIFTEITVDGTDISTEDQIGTLQILSEVDLDDTDDVMNKLEDLPDTVYDMIRPTIDFTAVYKIAMFIVFLYAAGFVLQAVQNWIMASVTQRLSKKMRSDISVKINRLPMSWYNRHTTGDVMSVVTNDVDLIGQSMNQSLGTFVSAIVLFVGSLIMMLITDVRMTVAAVLSCLVGFILMFVIMGHSQKYFTRQQRDLGALDGYIEENYAGHTVVKAYNGEEAAEKDFDKLNSDLKQSGFRAQCLAGLMQPIMAFIGNLGYVVVCIMGGVLALNGDIEFGVIVSFMLYVRYFTQPLGQIAQAMQSLQSAAAAGERVFKFLGEEEMEDESGKTKELKGVKGSVDFEHVRFRYDGASNDVIHDFSAHVKPGQKIAIVGPTGAGKTTMVNLLMRFYELNGGEIRIDGTPTKDVRRENVHDQFCMVLQDTWLFEGTVRENLVYNTPDVSQEKIDNACRSVGLDHFIRTLPNGYDTVLNDKMGLSQGQKQQLTIARAMIADKPMLILDEATSSVDTRTELKIQEAMDKLMSGRTSFVIAHRLSTIRDADLILVLKDGNIIESGTHEELLKKNGFYADLYNSQFEQGVVDA
jgi:ABC-type multidrug transport system fused ATPase/permease subunit